MYLGASALIVLALLALRVANRGQHADRSTIATALQFNRDIRPILADKCFACHGPDANQRQKDLRLDVRDVAIAARNGVQAIVPGKPSDSELVRRITSSDPAYRMPPPDSQLSLSADEVAVLEAWIAQGAEYQPHWAYLPIQRPQLPAVAQPGWAETPIDQFVLAELERHGISPSAEADPRTLARRLSFDIIGLPPTPEEVDAFVADPRPQAYGEFVDRLLASPHYGERMAMYWLDLVRFADTTGYNEDQHRHVYPYRDYVIHAFNSNVSFDQFTLEQIAGDLLPHRTQTHRIASGYNRLNKVSTENGSQEKEFLATYAADRVRTTAVTWMGATLGCAECHDHKFDPYTAKDFYSFAAFFADIDAEAVPSLNTIELKPEIAVPNQLHTAALLDQLEQQIVQLRSQRDAVADADETRSAFEAELAQWIDAESNPQRPLVSNPPFKLRDWSSPGALVSIDRNRRLRIESPPLNEQRPIVRTLRTGTGDVEFELDMSELHFSDERLHLIQTASWALEQANGPGRLELMVSRPIGDTIALTAHAADTRVVELGKLGEINSLRLRAVWRAAARQWFVDYHVNGELPLKPLLGGPLFNVRSTIPTDTWKETIGVATLTLPDNPAVSADQASRAHLDVRIGFSAVRPHEPLAAPPAEITSIRDIPARERSETQDETLRRYYLSVAPRFAKWNTKINELETRRRLMERSLPRTMVTVARKPRTTRVLPRGNWLDDTGEIVQPGVPAFLPALPSGAPNRLTLARWLVSRKNPLTARVLANRLWKLYFGHGIVATLDDFGTQGARPSHPELLDWLAAELVESGWDIKHMVRLLVTSRAYRQSSVGRPELDTIDPENRLYARQSSFRLDAEMVRDNALAVSGLLTRKIGGPSVKPYQPEHYWDGVSQVIPYSPSAIWKTSTGEDQYRRGLYTYWKRTFLHPSLLAFDAPTREESIAERGRSNTPLQALALLNDPTYVEAARVLAERSSQQGGTSAEQIRWAYRQTLARDADAPIVTVLTKLYDTHLHDYREQPDSAPLIATVGLSAAQWNGSSPELAALTSVCRVLLNLNETIMRY